jgi:CDP-diglyceride synthetase
MEGLIGRLWQWILHTRTLYHVDPIVFFILSTAAAPVFYYSAYRLVKAAAGKGKGKAMLWSTLFLCSVAAPYLYVLFFGRNFPWWVYIVIGLLAAQGVYALVRKLREKPKATKPDRPV